MRSQGEGWKERNQKGKLMRINIAKRTEGLSQDKDKSFRI